MYSIRMISLGSVFNPSFENFFINKKTNDGRLAVIYEFGTLLFFNDEFDYLFNYKVKTYNYTYDCYLQKNGVDWLPCVLELIPGTFDIDKKTCELALKSNDSTSKILAGQSVKYNVFDRTMYTTCLVRYIFGFVLHTKVINMFSLLESLINKIDNTILFDGENTWLSGFQGYYNNPLYSIGVSQVSDFILNAENKEVSNESTVWNMSFKQMFNYFFEVWNIDWYIDDTNVFHVVWFPNIGYNDLSNVGHDLQTWKNVNWTKNKNFANIKKPNWNKLQRQTKSIDADFKGVDIVAGVVNITEPKIISLNSILTDVTDINTRKTDTYGISNDVFVMMLMSPTGNYTSFTFSEIISSLYCSFSDGIFYEIYNVDLIYFDGIKNYYEGHLKSNTFIVSPNQHSVKYSLNIFSLNTWSDIFGLETPNDYVTIRLINTSTLIHYDFNLVGESQETQYPSTLFYGFYEAIFNNIPSGTYEIEIIFSMFFVAPYSGSFFIDTKSYKIQSIATENTIDESSGALTGISKQNAALSIANLDRDFGSRFPQKTMSINGVSTSVDIEDLDNFVELTYDVPVVDVVNDYDFTQKVKTDYSDDCSLVSVKQNFVGKPSQITVKTKLL